MSSGQKESISLGVTLADSLGVDLEGFLFDIEDIYFLDHRDSRDVTKDQLIDFLATDEIKSRSHNLDAVPQAIKYFGNLRKLMLVNTVINEIPDFICDMTKLKVLTMSKNKIRKVNPKIGQLVNLNSLSLSYNQITDLPSSIGNLTNLSNLALNGNRLYKLPNSLSNLSNLDFFHCDGNKLVELPDVSNWKKIKLMSVEYNNMLDQDDIDQVYNQLGRKNFAFNHDFNSGD